MRAADVRVIGELVVSHSRVRAEGRHVHVADIAAFPFVLFVLQLFDELILILPLPPTMAGDETVGEMLLGPRHIIIHLCLGRLFLQLLDLRFHVATLRINTDPDCETAEHSHYGNHSSLRCHYSCPPSSGTDCTLSPAVTAIARVAKCCGGNLLELGRQALLQDGGKRGVVP